MATEEIGGLIVRRWNTPVAPNDEFHAFLISPAGISSYTIQNIGSLQSSGFGGFAWSVTGSRFVYYNPQGLLELFDFDRCTGIISNPITIHPESTQPPYESYWGASFSLSDSILYATKLPLSPSDTSRLYQYDLYSPNIAASIDTLWETPFQQSMGKLKLAADGKIYIATSYLQSYPYLDSIQNYVNQNLSVINQPNKLGLACDLQPFSISLGGKRTYGGLPNNADYFLGPAQGSICDTLTSINEQAEQTIISKLFPNPNNGLFSVNYFLINGRSGLIEIYNMQGKTVYEKSLQAYSYVHQVHLKGSPAGIYALKLTSGRHTVYKKFIIQ